MSEMKSAIEITNNDTDYDVHLYDSWARRHSVYICKDEIYTHMFVCLFVYSFIVWFIVNVDAFIALLLAYVCSQNYMFRGACDQIRVTDLAETSIE